MKPPYPFFKLSQKDKRLCGWVTRQLVSIQWNEGKYEYEELENILRDLNDMNLLFFTKGLEKTKTLMKYLDKPVKNIESLGCPKLSVLPETHFLKCEYHRNNSNCSLYKAFRIAEWIKKNLNVYL